MTARKRSRDPKQTPLGREHARLIALSDKDSPLVSFQGDRTFQAEDLADWISSVGRTKVAIGPPSARQNPSVVGDLVICSIFSPGRVVALDRSTGVHRWSLKLGYLGDSSVLAPKGTGLVYCGTCQELHAVDATSGEVRWTFCPYGRKGESIYSSPTVSSDRLFIGDRQGYLHCLSATTGQPLWKVLTSRAKNNDVNSDPVIHGRVVAVGTNAGLAIGYDTVSGREIWRQRLDGSCTESVPSDAGDVVFWTAASAYRISAVDGTVICRWQHRNHRITAACIVGDLTLMVTQRVWGKDRLPWPTAELQAFRGNALVYTRAYPRWAMATVRYEPTTVRVYEATSHGIGILDPRTGAREFVIKFAIDNVASGRVPQPHVLEGRLYVASEDGRVFALEHPKLSTGSIC